MVDEPKWIKVSGRSKEEWQKDRKCYLLIRPNLEEKRIEVRVMGYDKKVIADYQGRCPEDIYYRIIEDGLITNLQHAAYLGSELRKVFIAIKAGKEYVQDEELDF